jgi:hypothetical protein
MPLPAEELGLPVLPDMAVEAAAAEPVEEMVENDTEELAAGAVEAQEDSDEDDDDEEEEAAEAVEGAASTTAQKRRSDDEPASFLAMYFRDMAELDVLRPEQEFETARNIEQMELDLWRTVLGFAPGTGWILEIVEKQLEKPLPEAKLHRAAAERARRNSSIPARTRFE